MIKWANIVFVFAFGAGVLFCAAVRGNAAADSGPVRLENLRKSDVKKPTTQPATQPAAPAVEETKPANTSEAPVQADPRKDFNITEKEIARRLREEPIVPVTPNKGWRRRGKRAKPLPPEGTAVVNHPCRIAREKDSEWLVVTFENSRDRPWQSPRRLLQCRLLERIEDILTKDPNTRFRISGETTIDLKHAYLLLQQVSVVEDDETDEPRTGMTGQKNLSPDEKARAAKGSAPSAGGTDGNSEDQPTPDSTGDLRKALLKDDPGRAVRVAPAPERTKTENIKSVAPAGKSPFSHGKKELVVDRIVRIIKSQDGDWWEAHFQSDNTLREPPLRIHPSLMLVRAQSLSRAMGLADLKLRISGQITYYRGRRFLLLRKLLKQRNMGQF